MRAVTNGMYEYANFILNGLKKHIHYRFSSAYAIAAPEWEHVFLRYKSAHTVFPFSSYCFTGISDTIN